MTPPAPDSLLRPSNRLTVGILSLGCPKTLVDSELVLGSLDPRRYRIAEHIGDCDIAVLNTCAFIQEAKEESIDHILKLAQLKQEGRIKAIVVLGCLVQRYQRELERELGEVDAFLGTGDYDSFQQTIDLVAARKKMTIVGTRPGFLYTSHMNRIPLTPSYSRYIKISEGCDRVCTFCTIPTFRGRHRSRQVDDILEEAHRLVDQGARELILTGQDTTYFGRDTHHEFLLPKLLKELNQIERLSWIRILYAYPSCVTDELIDALGTLDKVCHYLDMPLQHASDRILRAMKRGTTKKTIEALIRKLRSRIPDLALRTTFIVGFPGETDEDFSELLEFIKTHKFERLGIFMYSQEEGSESASFEEQIPDLAKRKRFHEGMMLQQQISIENNKRLLGKSLATLIEGYDDHANAYVGRSYQDAPDVDGVVYVTVPKGIRLQTGEFVTATITGTTEYDLQAQLASSFPCPPQGERDRARGTNKNPHPSPLP